MLKLSIRDADKYLKFINTSLMKLTYLIALFLLLLSRYSLANECPKSLEQWEKWRASLVLEAKDENHNWWETSRKLQSCYDRKTSTNDAVNKCMARLDGYLEQLMHARKGLGFKLSDKDYYEKTSKYTDFDPNLKNPDFLKWIYKGNAESLEKVKRHIEKVNAERKKNGKLPLEYLEHTGSIGSASPTGHGTKKRLLVWEVERAGTGPERIIAFALPFDRQITVVATIRTPEGKYRSYFKEWKTDRDEKGNRFLPEPERIQSAQSCRSCHQSRGPLKFIPTGTDKRSKKEIKLLEKLNARFEEYGPSPSEYDLPDLDFPALGTPTIPISTLFPACIKGLEGSEVFFKSLPLQEIISKRDILKKKIENYRNCILCHNGENRGRIIEPFGSSIFSRVSNGEMPPDNNLQAGTVIKTSDQTTNDLSELAAFERCLRLDYWGLAVEETDLSGLKKSTFVPGTLHRYLLEVSCLPSSPDDLKRHTGENH